MPKPLQPSLLGDRTQRLRLQAGKKHQECMGRGQHLRYRRPVNGQAGRWSARWRDLGAGGDTVTALGLADDYQHADGGAVLSYEQALDAARRWFSTKDTPAAPVQPVKAACPRARVLSTREIHSLRAACTPDFRQIVEGALHTGLLFREITQVRARDFCPAERTLTVRLEGKPARRIYLTQDGVAWFTSAVQGRQPGDLLFRRQDTPLQTSEWTLADKRAAMDEAVHRARISKVAFDDLVHTYAAALLSEGVPPLAVAQQLGYKDTRMVERRYGHLMVVDVAARVWMAAGALRTPVRSKVPVRVVEVMV